MVFTGVTVTVKPFAGNWVDIGPGADDGTGDLVQGRLGTNCAAGMGEQYERHQQCPSPAVSPCPAGGSSRGTRLPLGCHTHGTGVLIMFYR